MDFIEFLKDCKINNKELEFKDKSFIVGDKTYFSVTEKKKYINTVLDSERQPTQFTIFKFDKNSEDWCIYGPREVTGDYGEVSKFLNLTGYRISVNGGKVKFYFREPSFMEKWSVTTVMSKKLLTLIPFASCIALAILVLIFI